MASNLLNTLEKIERGRKKCIQLANEVNYPLPEDASLEQIAQCINAQGYADEYYESFKAWFTKDYSALPDGKVRLPDEIETLGSKAFYYVENIDVIWPRNLKTIGDFCFARAKFKNSFEIPNTVTTINQYAFDYVTGPEIHVPSSVTTMGNAAFEHGSNGTHLYYDGRVKTINGYTFGNSNAGTVGSGLHLHMTPESIATIESVGSNAFGQCTLYQYPINDTCNVLNTSALFRNTVWEVPVVVGANVRNSSGVLDSNAFYGAKFKYGVDFSNATFTSLANYACQNMMVSNEVLRFPETLTTFGLQCCQGLSRYIEGTTGSQKIPRIEIPNKEMFKPSSGQCFYNGYWENLIIYAKDVTLNSSFFINSSTSQPIGNIVFLNMETVPTAYSTTFNNNNLVKGNAYVYLPDDLVDTAKTMTYWSTIAARIKPLSEWPLYSEYTEHILPREEA